MAAQGSSSRKYTPQSTNVQNSISVCSRQAEKIAESCCKAAKLQNFGLFPGAR
jgi:hypothetical protein